MTIKTRNRLNLTLFVISICVFIFDAAFFVLKILKNDFDFSSFANYRIGNNILTRYNPYVPISAIFLQILYVICTSFLLFHIFEKTQASEIIYFHLFLVSCLIDSLRVWIPLFNVMDSYSNLLIFCGNSVVFAKILTPLSLFYTIFMSDTDKRQDTEKNVFILFCIAFFFSQIIPLNTAITQPNFSVDYSFKRTIKVASLVIMASCIIMLFVQNYKNRRSQKTATGYLLLFIGISILFYSTTILRFVTAVASLSAGTALYLKGLHNQYLWND